MLKIGDAVNVHVLMLLVFVASVTACATGLQSNTVGDCADGYDRDDAGDCISVNGAGDGGDLDADLGPNDGCETDDDCPAEDCPDGAMGCKCLEAEGVCVPTCDTASDCPEFDDLSFICDTDGICTPVS